MTTLTIPDSNCIEAALVMFRNTPETNDCSFLFVEGENDEKYLNGHAIESCYIVFIVSFHKNNQKKTGKKQVIENINTLNESKLSGFLGIVDDDFDSLDGIAQISNICVTDTHDLETLLLSPPTVFKRLLAEFGDTELIAVFENNTGPIQHYLIDLALFFAKIEWIKHCLQPNLDLSSLHKNNTILIRDKWLVDKDNLYSFIKNKGLNIDTQEAKQCLEKIANSNPWVLCNGHTMTDILAIGFQNGILGNNKKATSDSISSYIRAACDRGFFYQTELCQSILRWQNNNQPYKILID